MNRGHTVSLLACCLLAAVAAGLLLVGGAAAGATADGPGGPSGAQTAVQADATALAQEDVDPDDVLMSVTVADDGDTAWSIEYRVRLETDEDREAFADLQEDVESDPDPYVERFQERMDATAATAAEATGREMAITEMAVEAERRDLPHERGVVTYTFRWSNFAAPHGDGLEIGDAIDGLFLEEDTALTIAWSDTYELVDASPTPTETSDRSVTWIGPTNFAAGQPRVEVGPPTAVAPAFPVSPALAAALVVVLLAAGGAAFVVLRRRDPRGRPDHGVPVGEESATGATAAGAGSGAAAGGATASPPAPAADADGVGDDATGDVATGDDATGVAAGEGPTGPPDEELLSNEEQVLRLLERRGGRMKQKQVAEELEWTDAKTSQVTKKLRESGELEGFRLGRENVLTLPEADPRRDLADDGDGEGDSEDSDADRDDDGEDGDRDRDGEAS